MKCNRNMHLNIPAGERNAISVISYLTYKFRECASVMSLMHSVTDRVLVVFTEEILPGRIWCSSYQRLGFPVHKSKRLNGPYDTAASKPQCLTEISATYVGWYDIRTGILHPVIWGSRAENTRPCCAAAIGKRAKSRNGWPSVSYRGS